MTLAFIRLTMQPVVGLISSLDDSIGGRHECLHRHGVVGAL
jgi:hypothetical protein